MELNLDSSKLDINENLPFYINDYDETKKTASFICLRLIGNLTYKNIISADFSHSEKQLKDQFESIANDLQDLSYLIKSSNLIISRNHANNHDDKSMGHCLQIYNNYHKKEGNVRNESIKAKLLEFIPVELLKPASTKSDNRHENYSPIFTNHKGICRLETFFIPIDCLVLVETSTDIRNLHEIITEKVCSYVQAISHCYLSYYQNELNFRAQAFHFLVDNYIITCVYPSNKQDDELVTLRKSIHRLLDISEAKPLLRRIDSFQFNQQQLQQSHELSKYLQNPHLSAKPPMFQMEHSHLSREIIFTFITCKTT
jgi:hypothetical protein